MTDNTKKIITKTVGDVIVVFVYAGLALVELRVYSRLDVKTLGKLGYAVGGGLVMTNSIDHGYKAFKKIKDVIADIKAFRERNILEAQEEMEELMKKYTNTEYATVMENLFNEAIAEA